MLQEQYEIVQSIKCVREYCKEHGVFAYNHYMDSSFNHSLDEVLKVYYSIDPEFNEDPQDMINY